VLIRNATIWTGRVNGLEIIKGDLVLEKGLIKAVGVVPKDILTALEKEDPEVVDAKGAWVTPGCARNFDFHLSFPLKLVS
jgi:cytosine/adenosine deaminase-related metal-dependent hydrolase